MRSVSLSHCGAPAYLFSGGITVSCLRQVTTVIAFAILVILATNDLQAQQTLGGITGTVLDPSGSAVPGAEVKATSEDTKLERSTRSNAQGTYSLVDLPIGKYTVTFALQGFSTEKVPGILVQADRTITLPGQLAVGAVADSVEREPEQRVGGDLALLGQP